ncbi:MAG: hypothetical protein A2X49_15660 [Lentisphaerae bacterium GWF2_52_8]|nr:MAG: hypothetical protein A2X49_15660 [Lentisphaerae bacterium GWF2_52_8]
MNNIPLTKSKDKRPPINKGLVFSIVALILAAHALVIYFLVIRPRAPKPPPPAAKAPEPAPGTAAATPGKTHENPNFGKPFIYKNAVKGDIPGLPAFPKDGTGILIDLDTRQVLWSKGSREGVPIASMTKMMTLLLALEKIDAGKVNMDEMVQVSVAATKIGGSQVYLDPKESFPLRDLLKTVAIKSANDSAYLVSEHLGGGDVQTFVNEMNKRARELKMPSSKFFNAHGLPGNTASEDNLGSAEGMAILAEHLLEHPQAVQWASTKIDSFREKTNKAYQVISNHNHLVGNCPGVDGMKTGWIQRSGFCVTATCKRGGRRLVAVVTGFKGRRERDAYVSKLLDWGYRQSSAVHSSSSSPETAPAPEPAPTGEEAMSSSGVVPK